MKLYCLSKPVRFGFYNNVPNNSRVLTSLFSSKSQNPSSSSSSSDTLFNRIQVIRDPKASVLPVLRQWVSEGRPVDKSQLGWLVRTMKDFRRFNHALEISHWMTDSRFLPISASDAALRLDLIYRVHGLERAENYFNIMSRKLKTYNVYGALLRSYIRENSVEKAEATMEEMRNLGEKETSLPYNIMINLYTQNGEYDKIDELMREMRRKGIPFDKYTLRNRLSAYVAASDVLGMEKIIDRMEKDRKLSVDWKLYSLAASGYVKLGFFKEAQTVLQKLEQIMPAKKNKTALQFLLSLYASIQNKEELYRVWNKYKPSNGLIDAPYSCMIRSLLKLDDIDGAERIYEEWESKCKIYDFRVLNTLLFGYCRKGLLDKAESLLLKAVEERTPYASSWNLLANGYMDRNQIPKAVEMLKKALSIGRKGWMPNLSTLTSCLDYLKEQGDTTGMNEIINSLENLGVFSRDTSLRLLRTCDDAEESFSEVFREMDTIGFGFTAADGRNRVKRDGFSSDEETNEILEAR
ncbi:hypothetical protein UlMin_014236 [Ulmus minor]